MRRYSTFALLAGLAVSVLTPLIAVSATADAWFARAVEVDGSGTGTRTAKPDFLPGPSMKALCHAAAARGTHLSGTWELLAYDRAHRIGFASASTDECAVALFSAPAPPVRARNADLSAYRTARGLHVGSPYADVVSAYGGPPAAGTHFVRRFWAHVTNARTLGTPKRIVPIDETIVVVADNGRVSSISMRIDLSGPY